MSFNRFIYPLKRSRLPVSAGNKGINLHKLIKLGVKVPQTFICDWKAFQSYLNKDSHLESHLTRKLKNIVAPNKTYAIRSSANLEDSLGYSFAGQFDTYLNVQGVNAIMEAIKSVWDSVQTPIVRTYLEQHDIPDHQLLMAVLIQEMVKPEYSGVALSKNPVTGADEIVIEAVRGEGVQLVQSGVTPDRWINKWGYWLEKNDQSKIPFDLIQQIAEQIKEIASCFGYPVDMEWVYDGHSLFWVQSREITALNTSTIYSNYLAREMMPGMLKPLSFYVSAPLMSKSVLRWLSEIIGDFGVSPEELVKPFYYRAYFNMGAIGAVFKRFGFPPESIEMLIGALPPGTNKPKIKPTLKTFTRVPGILLFLVGKIGFSKRTKISLETIETQFQHFSRDHLSNLEPAEILSDLSKHNHLVEELAYYVGLSLFLLSMYNRVLKRLLVRRGVEFSDFDVTENMPELDAYYPSSSLGELYQQYSKLPPDKQSTLSAATHNQLNEINGLDDFPEKFANLLDCFGHLGDCGNDFSIPPWRETPDVLLRMVTDFKPPTQPQPPKIHLSDLKARHQLTPMFTFAYRQVRKYLFLREKASNLYTRGKVIYRYYYLALGQQFVNSGYINEPDDIFYLTPRQVEDIVYEKESSTDYRHIIAHHKQEIQRLKDVQMPTVIYGETPPPINQANTKILAGISTSMGTYTGRVCVIKSFRDFQKLKQGEVLVIPYSDVSWAPLFARAGALISEAGGMLSHGSIVAREYKIPAIVSVEMATQIPDGTLVTVDAQRGLVLINESIQKE